MIFTQKYYLSCIIWILKVSLRMSLIQNGGLSPLRSLPLMTEFSEFMSIWGIGPGSSWLGDISLKDYKIIWKIKVKQMKAK